MVLSVGVFVTRETTTQVVVTRLNKSYDLRTVSVAH